MKVAGAAGGAWVAEVGVEAESQPHSDHAKATITSVVDQRVTH
jgi:hypothetical protein